VLLAGPGITTAFSLRNRFSYAPSDLVFLLPCNLRPVKDPLFLVAAFEEWHALAPDVHLLMVGPSLDAAYTSMFLEKVRIPAKTTAVLLMLDLPDGRTERLQVRRGASA
jgi:hypothetical protein